MGPGKSYFANFRLFRNGLAADSHINGQLRLRLKLAGELARYAQFAIETGVSPGA
jgi:hypothetical protein